MRSPSDVLCWSFRSHGSQIQPLAQLPCRQCMNLRRLGQAPRREAEGRPCSTLSEVIVLPGPRPLRHCLKQCGEPRSLCLLRVSLSALGCKATLQGFGVRDRFSAMVFGCSQRHCWVFTADMAAHGGPAAGHTRGGSVPSMSWHMRKSPRRGSRDRRHRLCWGAAVTGSAGSAACLCQACCMQHSCRSTAGLMCAQGSAGAGMGHGGSGQVRPQLRLSPGFRGISRMAVFFKPF